MKNRRLSVPIKMLIGILIVLIITLVILNSPLWGRWYFN